MKLQATIQTATDAGEVGSAEFAKAGAGGRANNNLARDFKHIATNIADIA
ncbi:MAG: hypothetical protein ACKPKO_03625 [Candidatus Fonsibacter sp.]